MRTSFFPFLLTRWSRMALPKSRVKGNRWREREREREAHIWKSLAVNWRAVFCPLYHRLSSRSLVIFLASCSLQVKWGGEDGKLLKQFFLLGSGRPTVCHLATWNVPAPTPPGFLLYSFLIALSSILETNKQQTDRLRKVFYCFWKERVNSGPWTFSPTGCAVENHRSRTMSLFYHRSCFLSHLASFLSNELFVFLVCVRSHDQSVYGCATNCSRRLLLTLLR